MVQRDRAETYTTGDRLSTLDGTRTRADGRERRSSWQTRSGRPHAQQARDLGGWCAGTARRAEGATQALTALCAGVSRNSGRDGRNAPATPRRPARRQRSPHSIVRHTSISARASAFSASVPEPPATRCASCSPDRIACAAQPELRCWLPHLGREVLERVGLDGVDGHRVRRVDAGEAAGHCPRSTPSSVHPQRAPNHFLDWPPEDSITSSTPGFSDSMLGTWFARMPMSPLVAAMLT